MIVGNSILMPLVVQFTAGNIVEPRIMGIGLNLSRVLIVVAETFLEMALRLHWKFWKSPNQKGNMKVRTNLLIVFVAAVFVLATVSHGFAVQQPTYQQNQSGNNSNSNNYLSGSENAQKSMTNQAGSRDVPPPTQRPVFIRHVGWSWLLISGLIGFLLGRATNPRRRPHGTDEDIRRNRAA